MNLWSRDFGWFHIHLVWGFQIGLAFIFSPGSNQIGVLFGALGLIIHWDDSENEDEEYDGEAVSDL